MKFYRTLFVCAALALALPGRFASGFESDFSRLVETARAAAPTMVQFLRANLSAATGEDQKEVDARAKEIAPMLADAPNYGARTAPRELWDKLAANPSAKNIVKSAEDFLDQPLPDMPESLYKEFLENGNRDNYQRVFGALTRRIDHLTLAEMFENKGRFLDALDKAILYFCDQPSWLLPAHDKGGEVYDGKAIYSDLGATLAAGNLAITINLLEDKLPAETVERAKSEIERRILAPYRDAIAAQPPAGMWWMRTVNNWNAVCHAGTVAAALNVLDSKEDRALFLAGADYFSEKYFMQGFTNDGYCSEGMGYWNYGFGNYLVLGALARNATDGKLDFFRFPKIRAILDYAPNLEIDKGNCAVFADCSMTAKPSALYVGYLSRLKGYGYTDFEKNGLGDKFRFGDQMEIASFGFDVDVTFAEPGESKEFKLPLRTDFPDAGALICRPSPDAKGAYFAVALKGGSNGELHNHNDVGSYSLLMGDASKPKDPDVFISRDPGGERYTARTFSSRRYEGQLLNSFGHPVPRIAGKLQSAGGGAKGIFIEKETSDALDKFVIDFKSAYDVPTLDKLTRTFEYGRATGDDPGFFKIVDSVSFKDGAKEDFETAIITFEKVEIKSDGDAIVATVGPATVTVAAVDADGNSLKLVAEETIVGKDDPSTVNKPTRVAFRVDGKTNSAIATQSFAPAK
ncbi:MAG: hypothetical protein IJM30_13355 [Thermoguttaceae bacterium]|nr:hypothetical protein [Thermoguttaceae bacterium]